MSRAARRAEPAQVEVKRQALAFRPSDPDRIPFIAVCTRGHEVAWLGAMSVHVAAGEPWSTCENWRSYIERRKLDSATAGDYIKVGRETFNVGARVVTHDGTFWEFRCPYCRRQSPRFNQQVNSDRATEYAWKAVVLCGQQFLDISDPDRDWPRLYTPSACASRACMGDDHDKCDGAGWNLNPAAPHRDCGCPCHCARAGWRCTVHVHMH